MAGTRSRVRHVVGRSHELADFERAVAMSREGVPQVLLLGGEGGIGKSTLIAEGAARADVGLYLGRCVHIGGDVIPLAPLADLLRQISRSVPAVMSSLGVAPLADWLTRSSDAAEAGPSSRENLFVAVLELVSTMAADDAVVVGFEDLHWADAVTWDLFEFLVRNLVDERVVLVGTYRSDEARNRLSQRRRLAELPRLQGVQPIHLDAPTRIHHSGSLLTFSAQQAVLPASGYGVAMLFNSSSPLLLEQTAVFEGVLEIMQGGGSPSNRSRVSTSTMDKVLALATIASLLLGTRGVTSARRWAAKNAGSLTQVTFRLAPHVAVFSLAVLFPNLLSLAIGGRDVTWVAAVYAWPALVTFVLISAVASLGALLARVRHLSATGPGDPLMGRLGTNSSATLAQRGPDSV